MDVEAHVHRRAAELARPDADHPAPWLAHLSGHGTFCDVVSNWLDRLDGQYDLVEAAAVHRRLKPDGRVRKTVCVPLETDLRMARQSVELVTILDRQVRRPISYANPVRMCDGMWSRIPFAQQRRRDPPGNHRLFKLALEDVKASWPLLTITDIQRYFGSLQWHRVIDQIARLAGIDGRDVDAALTLHGKLWWYTDAVMLGMPAGCDLSHVLGTALLSTVDDQLMSLLEEQAAVRLVDDVKFGVETPDYADYVLDELVRGSLADLHLALHPDKTDLIASRRYINVTLSGAVSVDNEDQVESLSAAELAQRLAGMPSDRPLPKDESRPLLEAAGGDEAAVIVADYAPLLLAGNYRELPVRLRQLAGEPLPEEITDRLLAALAYGVEPDLPTDGETAYVLSYLFHDPSAHIGASGRRHLKAIATNQRRAERTRATAAWILASETDDFDRQLLEQLNGMSRPAARGILAAAHRAGAKPTPGQWAAGAIAA